MKKQHIPPSSLEKNALLTALEDNPAIEWLGEHGKKILYTFLGLLALLFIVYRVSVGSHAKAENDYLQAATDFTLIKKEGNQEAINRLTAILQRRPELHAQYDGLLAQILLNQGNLAKAKEFADLALKRTSTEDLPYYTDFSKTTLLMCENRNQEALQQAVALKQAMLTADPSAYGPLLFAFNLLRIAILQQQMGNREEERKAWQEWIGYANAEKKPISISPKIFETIENHLSEGKTSLSNYIESRQKM